MTAQIGTVHHVGVTVSDLDTSMAFYRDVLGCTVVMEQERQGGYLAAIVGYPDAHVRMAHLHDPSGRLIIELFEYVAPVPLAADLEPRRIGNAHLCFLVPDLDAVYERLIASDVSTFSPPIEVNAGANRGGKALYLRDPDGITLELFEPSPGSDAEKLMREST